MKKEERGSVYEVAWFAFELGDDPVEVAKKAQDRARNGITTFKLRNLDTGEVSVVDLLDEKVRYSYGAL